MRRCTPSPSPSSVLKENRPSWSGCQHADRPRTVERLGRPLEEKRSENKCPTPVASKVDRAKASRKVLAVPKTSTPTNKLKEDVQRGQDISCRRASEKFKSTVDTPNSRTKGKQTGTPPIKLKDSAKPLTGHSSRIQKDRLLSARDTFTNKLNYKPYMQSAFDKKTGSDSRKTPRSFLSPQGVKKNVKVEPRRKSIASHVESKFRVPVEEADCLQQLGGESDLPPVMSTYSPEVLRKNSNSRDALPLNGGLFGAGTMVTPDGLGFVRDRRKCKPRGILVVGVESQSFDSDTNSLVSSSIQIPLPAAASVEWMICDNPLGMGNDFQSCSSKQTSSGSQSDFRSCESQVYDFRGIDGKIRDGYEDVFLPQGNSMEESDMSDPNHGHVLFLRDGREGIGKGNAQISRQGIGQKIDCSKTSISFSSSWITLGESRSTPTIDENPIPSYHSSYSINPITPEYYRVSQLPEGSKLIDALVAGSVRRRIIEERAADAIESGEVPAQDLSHNPLCSNPCSCRADSNPSLLETTRAEISGVMLGQAPSSDLPRYGGDTNHCHCVWNEVSDNEDRVETASPIGGLALSPSNMDSTSACTTAKTVFGACETFMSKTLEKLLQHNISL